MSDLDRTQFRNYFEDVHGVPPFPWQERLLDEVLDRGWPQAIDLPTGTGKTAVLDIALFALAIDPQRFPRRIFFVIDRRIIVDQVYRRADRIQTAVQEGSTDSLAAVREALRDVSGGDAFGATQLRGGAPRDRDWAKRPDQPWVTVSTVDQFGSRLLFRGYGVSDRMRPIHAGLTGNDALVILDEVHLSRPLAETLRAVSHRDHEPISKKFAVVEMSATPGTTTPPFQLFEADLDQSDELRRRVTATKLAVLRKVGTARHSSDQAITDAIPKILTELPAEARLVGIVVNRVKTAREVHRQLAEADETVDLITGRMRPMDRAVLLKELDEVLDPEKPRSFDRRYVVATQAIEVGADFSFDALITECAPIDALRQRFGRLDRRGSFESRTGAPAQAWILGVSSEIEGSKDDPIYGQSVRNTWNELTRRHGDTAFDVGPRMLTDLPTDCSAPHHRAPLLLPSHLDAWCQTNPEPPIQPDPRHFLHGLDTQTDSDVEVVYRHDRSSETLRICRPRPSEYLSIPIAAARAWLSNRGEPPVADIDLPRQDVDIDNESSLVEVWRNTEVRAVELDDLRPGDVILVDPVRGGIRSGNWDPAGQDRVSDLGDRAQWEYGERLVLRVDHRLYSDAPIASPDDDQEVTKGSLDAWLAGHSSDADWFGEACSSLKGKWERRISGSEAGYPILVQRNKVDEATFDGSDETQSQTGLGTTLHDHLNGVGRRTRVYAERLGLEPALVADLELAAELHDIGKVEPRFQRVLVGGDEVTLASLPEPLAKSVPGSRWLQVEPVGFRHELLSVALAESNPELLTSAGDPDLVLHLIATHHGHGRPLPTVVLDPSPRTITYRVDGVELSTETQLLDTPIALEAAGRFWRLQQRYGIYGLAWLETILRLADHRESADPEGEA